MSEKSVIHAGIVGAGAISGRYLDTIQKKFPVIRIDGICASHMEHAMEKAKEFGIRACTLEEMLDDPAIRLIIVLTPVGSHYDIIRQALLSGKNVYTEKTMTDEPEKARELVKIAEEKHLELGCAPDTFLGAALQTARKAIDDGMIGEVTSFSAAANRCNDLLLSVFPFLRRPGAGITYDYGAYYITVLVSLLGPVGRVASVVRAPYPKHKNIFPESPEFGKEMDTPNESEVSAVLQMKSGVAGTFMLNADSVTADQARFAVYGTEGILYLTDPNQFGGDVLLQKNSMDPFHGPALQKLTPVNSYSGESRGLGAADLAEAVLTGRAPRASMELGMHVLDVLSAILKSGTEGKFEEVHSTCVRPEPLLNNI